MTRTLIAMLALASVVAPALADAATPTSEATIAARPHRGPHPRIVGGTPVRGRPGDAVVPPCCKR